MSAGKEETFFIDCKTLASRCEPCTVRFQNEDIRGIQCFQTESLKCLLQNYKQNIHHGLQCSLLLNLILLTVVYL